MSEQAQKSLMNNWWLCITLLQSSVELLHWIRGRGGCEHSSCVYCTLGWYMGQCVTLCVSDKDGACVSINTTQSNQFLVKAVQVLHTSCPLSSDSLQDMSISCRWSLNQLSAYWQHHAVLSTWSDADQVTVKLNVNEMWPCSDQQRELRPAHPSSVPCYQSISDK